MNAAQLAPPFFIKSAAAPELPAVPHQRPPGTGRTAEPEESGLRCPHGPDAAGPECAAESL